MLQELGHVPNEITQSISEQSRGSLAPFDGREPEAWDDFPNGRWGDSRSPAFGEIDGYGASLHVEPPEALALWGSPETLDDVGVLLAEYCKGKISALPWSPDPILPESRVISHRLVEMNKHHLFTVGSQPAVDGVPSNDSTVGWGPRESDGNYVYQKPFVEFFVDPRKAEVLLKRLSQSSKVTFYAASSKSTACVTNAQPGSRTAVTWGVFVGKEIVQPTIVDEAAFMAWKTEASVIWNEWSLVHPVRSATRALLKQIYEDWWLVNVVYDDYRANQNDIFDVVLGGGATAIRTA